MVSKKKKKQKKELHNNQYSIDNLHSIDELHNFDRPQVDSDMCLRMGTISASLFGLV
jgi:hypothetical protein